MESKILLAGIGGQGVLFIHRLLADCAVAHGHPVAGAETHGMSQRGGSIVSHLKIGHSAAPLIRQSTADLVLVFNASEAFRNLPFVRRGGTIVVNTGDRFPEEKLQGILEEQQIGVRTLDADGIARGLGRATAANVALLGFTCACTDFPLPRQAVRDTLRQVVRPQSLEWNLQAFDEGVRAGGQAWDDENGMRHA